MSAHGCTHRQHENKAEYRQRDGRYCRVSGG